MTSLAIYPTARSRTKAPERVVLPRQRERIDYKKFFTIATWEPPRKIHELASGAAVWSQLHLGGLSIGQGNVNNVQISLPFSVRSRDDPTGTVIRTTGYYNGDMKPNSSGFIPEEEIEVVGALMYVTRAQAANTLRYLGDLERPDLTGRTTNPKSMLERLTASMIARADLSQHAGGLILDHGTHVEGLILNTENTRIVPVGPTEQI